MPNFLFIKNTKLIISKLVSNAGAHFHELSLMGGVAAQPWTPNWIQNILIEYEPDNIEIYPIVIKSNTLVKDTYSEVSTDLTNRSEAILQELISLGLNIEIYIERGKVIYVESNEDSERIRRKIELCPEFKEIKISFFNVPDRVDRENFKFYKDIDEDSAKLLIEVGE